MKYYPARLTQNYRNIEEALHSAGFSDQQINTLIANATINQSESVYADIGPGRGVVAVKLSDGTVGLWQACIDPLCDSLVEAIRKGNRCSPRKTEGKCVGSF